ncbi:MAG: GlsB/YeaQ/YmgE family stress response membrane protein [Anaerolineae bacterium]|nr:GlsB/YeaQ/YmgE family stress response membrane protein [Anaerolineae bacterium]
MSISIGQLLVWLLVGSLAGFLAGLIWRGRGYGVAGNLAIGLIGALLGGVLFNLLNISITGLPTFTFSLADLLVAVIGALLLLFILRIVGRR